MSHESEPDTSGEPQNSLELLMRAMLGDEGYEAWKEKPEREIPDYEAIYKEKSEEYAVLSEHARDLLEKQGMRSEQDQIDLISSMRTQPMLKTVVPLRTWPIKFTTPPEAGWSRAVLRVTERLERVSYDDSFSRTGRLANIRVTVSAEDDTTTADIVVREPNQDDFVSMDNEAALTALQLMRDAIDG